MTRTSGLPSARVIPVTQRDIPAAATGPTASSTESVDASAERRLSPLQLTLRAYRGFWALVLALHALSAVFLIACARLYWYMEHPYMSYYADLLAPASERHFKLVGSLLGVLGACNALEGAGLVCASLYARRPAVPSAPTATVVLRALRSLGPRWWRRLFPPQSALSPLRAKPAQAAGHSPRPLQVAIHQAVSLFSVQSSHFRAVFTAREAVEIGTQVAQCYSFSQRIVRPWINHVLVTLVALNCLSTALLYPLLRRWDVLVRHVAGTPWSPTRAEAAPPPRPGSRASPALARLLCVLVDCLLSVGTSILLPVAVFAPYARQYEPEAFTFPLALLYSDTEFPSLVRENQALFVRSVLDIVYKIVPLFNILFCLLIIASLLRDAQVVAPSPSATNESMQRTAVVGSTEAASASTSALGEPIMNAHLLLRRCNLHGSGGKLLSASRLKHLAVTTAFVGVGLCVVSLHFRAMAHSSYSPSNASTASMCLQPVHPWFASGDSCAVIEFSCHRHNVSTPATDALQAFNPEAVSAVVFMHCPALVMPAAIQSFRNLLGLEIYNCTIQEWGADAALTDSHHPNMIFLVLVLVEMSELPPGVLQTPFPAKLGDIELSKTNLTALPAALPDVWADVALVYLEHSLFTELPRELLSIPALSELSMIGNEIRRLPDDFSSLIATDDFYFLALAANPLASLPPTIRPGLSFGFLSLEATDVAELPAWAGAAVTEGLHLAGTPLCASSAADTDPVVKTGCATRDDRSNGRYPLTTAASIRPL